MAASPVPMPNIDDIVKEVMKQLQPRLDELAEGSGDVDTDAIVADVLKRVTSEVNKQIVDAKKELERTLTSQSGTIEQIRERVNDAFKQIRLQGRRAPEDVPPSPEPVPTPRRSGPFLPTLLDED